MDTRIAIHALSRSIDITSCAACGIVIRITYRDALVTICDTYRNTYRDIYVAIQYAYRRPKYHDASMHRYDPNSKEAVNYLPSNII